MPEPIILEVFTDYVCPWCYLGDNRVKKLKQNYDITVQLVHFPLHPETPAEGRTLLELFGFLDVSDGIEEVSDGRRDQIDHGDECGGVAVSARPCPRRLEQAV